MDRQALKDARHHTIGYIDTAADGKQACRDARYHVVGYYDPHTNLTRDARFRMIGSGDLPATLLSCG